MGHCGVEPAETGNEEGPCLPSSLISVTGRQKLLLECVSSGRSFPCGEGEGRRADRRINIQGASGSRNKKGAFVCRITRCLHGTAPETSGTGSLPTSSSELFCINSTRWGRFFVFCFYFVSIRDQTQGLNAC